MIFHRNSFGTTSDQDYLKKLKDESDQVIEEQRVLGEKIYANRVAYAKNRKFRLMAEVEFLRQNDLLDTDWFNIHRGDYRRFEATNHHESAVKQAYGRSKIIISENIRRYLLDIINKEADEQEREDNPVVIVQGNINSSRAIQEIEKELASYIRQGYQIAALAQSCTSDERYIVYTLVYQAPKDEA